MPLADFTKRFPRICGCLCEARAQNRVGQAYLFVGDDTELLAEFVVAFAQLCTCTQPGDGGDACGACDSCRRLAAGTYPEWYEVVPQSKSRQILIDNMRQLEHQLGLAVGPRVKKFGVIAEADCMGEEAQNAFLKTLEEPGPNTLLLLYTTRPRHLLPTIRSRCQTISLMTNRRDYSHAAQLGLFSLLSRLHFGAGAAVGLEVAAKLRAIFAALHAQAEESVTANRGHDWDELAADDPALKKRLEEELVARIEADYLRRRAGVEDAILTWYLQQMLAAGGVAPENLPHPEMFHGLDSAPQAGAEPCDEAEKNILLTEEFIRCMEANVPEDLAVDTFCLSVTEKSKRPKKTRSRA